MASLVALFVAVAASGRADRFAAVEIEVQPVAGSVYMLKGAGGNIGVSVGADGTLIVDDQFAPLAARIEKALQGLGGGKPRLVLNTHFHGDHTGGNAHFGAEGTILAHDNVRIRLLAEQGMNRAGLPLVTFADRLTVHFNDEEIQIVHMPSGHTDGDSVVWFKNANVIHMGDHLFNGRFPFIDLERGGSVRGYLRNLKTLHDMVPEDVRVIPGHGALGDKAAIRKSIDMIEATQGIVRQAHAAGRSAEEIASRGLGAEWAAFGTGFIDEERWIAILLAGLESGS
ncbi:MAG: MBL fold metallo-hydrolase [Deltaproteobacteria bacterium]|nr:MBL fold metallo-hydrolase [Deltaproteobacteria bacterium]